MVATDPAVDDDDGTRMFGEEEYDDGDEPDDKNVTSPAWKPGKELVKRKQVMRKNIKALRPHEVTAEMADGG